LLPLVLPPLALLLVAVARPVRLHLTTYDDVACRDLSLTHPSYWTLDMTGVASCACHRVFVRVWV
jgi:hypothetical protein